MRSTPRSRPGLPRPSRSPGKRAARAGSSGTISGWSPGSALTGRIWMPATGEGAASATACATRRGCCATGPWCPAAWIMRGMWPSAISSPRVWRRSCFQIVPGPSGRAFRTGAPWRSFAAAAGMQGVFEDLQNQLFLRRRLCYPELVGRGGNNPAPQASDTR